MVFDAQRQRRTPLFDFGYHPSDDWLDIVRDNIKLEPWGKSNYILKKYLQINFELAQRQGKVFEDEEAGVAYWHPGFLINEVADPIWMTYKTNRTRTCGTKWYFAGVCSGDVPYRGVKVEDYQVSYDIPPFKFGWRMFFDQQSLDHIFEDPQNAFRLQYVFGNDLYKNKHLVFRVLFGEISLQQKDVLAAPQWYHGDYQYVVPLFLTQPNRMELAAILTPNERLRRYDVSTLLLPGQVYSAVRPVATSRKNLPQWLQLSSTDIDRDSEVTLGFLNQLAEQEY